MADPLPPERIAELRRFVPHCDDVGYELTGDEFAALLAAAEENAKLRAGTVPGDAFLDIPPAAWPRREGDPAMTPDDLKALRDAVASRAKVRTHFNGCWLFADHRDCAILRLLSEVERLRAQRDALVAAGDCVVLACFDTAQRWLISTRLLQQIRDLANTVRAVCDEKENTDG